MRHVELRRRAIFHLWPPEGELRVFCGPDMVHHLLRGDNFGIREGFHQRLQAEIEIRIAGSDHDFVQRFTAVANFFYQRFAIFHAELGVKQYRLFRARYQRGRNGKNAFFLRVIRINGQRSGKDGRSEKGCQQSKAGDSHGHVSVLQESLYCTDLFICQNS